MVEDKRSMPFLWQDKDTIRLIREAFQEERGNKLAFAIAVYVCMTEIASNWDNDVSTITITQNELAKMTGLSLNTVKHIIDEFEWYNIVETASRYGERVIVNI